MIINKFIYIFLDLQQEYIYYLCLHKLKIETRGIASIFYTLERKDISVEQTSTTVQNSYLFSPTQNHFRNVKPQTYGIQTNVTKSIKSKDYNHGTTFSHFSINISSIFTRNTICRKAGISFVVCNC